MKKPSFARNFFMLLLLAVLVYIWFPSKTHPVLLTDATFSTLFLPFQNFFGQVFLKSSQVKDRIFYLHNAALQNQKLRSQLALHKIKIFELQQKIDQLSQTQKIATNYPTYRPLPVEVIGHDPFVATKSVTVNAGKNQGVKVNAVVVADSGLVGRVIKTYDDSSLILLVTDPHFKVDAMSMKTKNRIILRGVDSDLLWGKGYPLLTQTEFLLHENAFQEGEELVTSGFGGLYPAGIPVGKIVEVGAKTSGLFSEADVLPAVDFTQMKALFILLASSS